MCLCVCVSRKRDVLTLLFDSRPFFCRGFKTRPWALMAPFEYEIACKQWLVVSSLNFKNHRRSLPCFQNFKCGQSWATLSEKIAVWNFCGLAMASPRQLRPEMFRSQRDGRIDRSCRWDKMGHAGSFSRRYQAVCRNFQQFQGRNWEVIQFRKWIHL